MRCPWARGFGSLSLLVAPPPQPFRRITLHGLECGAALQPNQLPSSPTSCPLAQPAAT
jgi:hypothetical protein